MKVTIRIVLYASLLSGPVCFSEDLALVGATVITATGDAPLENAVVLVDDDTISYVGNADDAPALDGYRRVDVRDKWITPGLIDTNIHLILMTVPEFFIKYEDRLTEIAIQSAQVGLKYGLTTMPDTWGPLKPLLEARDRINNGEFVGARVLVAGNIIGTGGPFSQYFMGGWDPRGLTIRYGGWVQPAIQRRIDALWEDDVGPAMLAMTAEEAADTLRDYIAKGIDFVKVGISGHSLGAVEPLMFSPSVLRAMRKVVRDAGIPFTTHTFTVESLRIAIELEPDLLVHPNVMSVPYRFASDRQKTAVDGLIESITDKNIYSGLMAIPEKEQTRIYEQWEASEHPENPDLNEIMVNRRLWISSSTFEERAAGVKRWLDSGLKYTIATDQGPEAADLGPVVWGRLGRAHFGRMEGLQDIGASPMEIIIAATRYGAEAYNLGDRLGTVEVGKLADLLILDADPLADISNIRKINQVIKDGMIIDRDALPTVKILDYDPEAIWPY